MIDRIVNELDDYSLVLIRRLRDEDRVSVFAMLCAERVSVIADRLASAEEVRCAVGSALEMGWSMLRGGDRKGDAEIIKAIVRLDALLDLGGRSLGQYHNYLDDVIASAAYALEVVARKDVGLAVNVADRVREVYFQVAQKIWPRSSVEVLLDSPVVKAEVDRQARDVNDLCAASEEDLPRVAVSMRRRASEEGCDLVGLILGRTVGSFSNDVVQEPVFGQQSLFRL